MANSARLDAALAAASAAADLIRSAYAGEIDARAKADGSPVTAGAHAISSACHRSGSSQE